MRRSLAPHLRTGLFVVGMLAVASASVRADTMHTPRLKAGAPVSIQGYGRQNPACLEWTDGCVLCTVTEGHAACSTPGIACVPAGLTCKRKR